MMEVEVEQNDVSDSEHASKLINTRKRKSGVIYIQTVPPLFTVTKMREVLSSYGEVGRIFLKAEKYEGKGGRKYKRYNEGWVEFKKKRTAKDVARILNGKLVGGRRRSAARDTLWTIRYLKGCKWIHLMEQLNYEHRVDEQRLRTEISHAKRTADHFSQQIEKGERIRRLEEKVLKKGGLWERYQMQIQQRSIVNESKKQKSKSINESQSFLKMIFDAENQL